MRLRLHSTARPEDKYPSQPKPQALQRELENLVYTDIWPTGQQAISAIGASEKKNFDMYILVEADKTTPSRGVSSSHRYNALSIHSILELVF